MKTIIVTIISAIAIIAFVTCGIVLTARTKLKVESSPINTNTIEFLNTPDCINDITRIYTKYGVHITSRDIKDIKKLVLSYEIKEMTEIDNLNKEVNSIIDAGCKAAE